MKKDKDQNASRMLRRANGDEHRDLGFGSVVASESRERLLNRDGSFNVDRTGLSFWSSFSLYHSLLNMSWLKFLSALTIFYILTNGLFAFAYMLCGRGSLVRSVGDISGAGFLDAFFFSVQTFSTIGYGNLSPVGFAANMIVTVEALVGLLGVALATGLIFARFSRPTAKVIFSSKAVIAPYREMSAFMFRVTNGRRSQLIELRATVLFARFEEIDGGRVRRFYPLNLERDRVVFFPLSWTVVHPIDEASPLRGLTEEDLLNSEAEFLVLFTGIDETFSQRVHTRSSYQADEVIWNARFRDIYNRSANSHLLTVDIRRLHDIDRV
jgi:inward rectifier potassium channel